MTSSNPYNSIQPVQWKNDNLFLLDQRLLPKIETYNEYSDLKSIANAITDMVVRGAPAIGVTAAYGIVIAARTRFTESAENWKSLIQQDLDFLANARPTAINLAWAIAKMRPLIDAQQGNPYDTLLNTAKTIHQNDIENNVKIGNYGASLLGHCSVLTHCNAGALATGGYGTALGVIRSGFAEGKIEHVYADETRPWFQGARLTAWELKKDNIPVTLITEGAAGWLMKQGKIEWVIVGSDRIVANGDVANKIGTYNAAVLAKHHGLKVMVAAPTSTIDMDTLSGNDIPIEERSKNEVFVVEGNQIATEGINAWNPVFDVTPASLVDAIVTEKGIVENPTLEKMQKLME